MGEQKWLVFASAPNQIAAEAWKTLLISCEIPCRLHPRDTISFMGISATSVRLMTTTDYLERAKNILEEEISPQPGTD